MARTYGFGRRVPRAHVEDSLIFVDRGISAASRHNRPELLRCIRRAPEYRVLLVWDFSWLARNLEDHGWVENQLVAAGAKAISVSNGLELGGVASDVMGALSAEWRRAIGAGTHRGQRSKFERGFAVGSLPFGYRRERAGENVEIRIDVAQAEVVQRIFREYAAGASYRTVAEGLTRDGVPKPKARGRGHRGSPAWCPTSIRSILVNHCYTGLWQWNRTQKLSIHGRQVHRARDRREWVTQERPDLAIVDRELWDVANARRRSKATRVRRAGRNATTRGTALLSGLVQCGECGSNFYTVYRDRWGCGLRHNRGATACSNPTKVPKDELEGRVLHAIQTQILVPGNVDYIAELVVDQVRAPLKQENDSSTRPQVEQELGRLYEQVARTGPSKRLDEMIAERESRLQSTEAPKAIAPSPAMIRYWAEQQLAELHSALRD